MANNRLYMTLTIDFRVSFALNAMKLESNYDKSARKKRSGNSNKRKWIKWKGFYSKVVLVNPPPMAIEE
jgi:hypothetical protein